ncbi:MAG: SDR family oxidoreductase [Acidobacteria bacterium]|nr:SDR family oxidoreductase [Acidobacteriota bacterium]
MSKIALVTGAGSGIGRAVSQTLQASGYVVLLTGRREEELHKTAAGASNMHVFPADVSSEQAVADLFARIESQFGRLDVLFNNAGTNAPAVPINELPVGEWHKVVGVNLTGAFLCARAAFGLMKRQTPQGGRIINNGSISATTPRPYSAPYTATKHAVTGLTKSLALDGRKFNIAAGQIDIGNAATEMTSRMTQGVLQANFELATEPRMDARHVADAVLYMANLPLEANVLTMTVMATAMPFSGRG